jgi:hypothetical protein
MKNVFVLFCLSFHTLLFGQSRVDSAFLRLHGNNRFQSNCYHHILTLSDKNGKSRLIIDDKNHNVIIEDANKRTRFIRHLDSVCNFEKYPINCSQDDSVASKYPNKEKFDWGNSIQIFDSKLKKQRIERKDLLKKWFGNLDSIVSCREVFINDDKKPDLAIVRKVRGERMERDSITYQTTFIPDNTIDFEIEILINRDTCYSIISHVAFTELKCVYLANFRVTNGRFLYFMINKSDKRDVNSLYITEEIAD